MSMLHKIEYLQEQIARIENDKETDTYSQLKDSVMKEIDEIKRQMINAENSRQRMGDIKWTTLWIYWKELWQVGTTIFIM